MFGIGSSGIKVGEVYAEAGVRVDESGFREFDRRHDKIKRDARIPTTAEAKLDVDRRGFDRFDRNLDKAERDAKRSSGRIRSAFGAIAQGAGVAGVAAGIFGFKAVQAASDTAEALTASEALFGRHARGIERWSKRTAGAMGVSRRAALDATNDYGALFATIGLGEKPASEMSRRLVRLASDLASFRNADPSEVLLALKSGLIGEAEPMRRFGALLSETRVQAEAWRSGIAKQGEELTEQQKVQARYNLILEDTRKAHGDYAKTAGGLANQQRQLSARWDDLQAKLGVKLMPTFLKVTAAFNKLLGQFQRGKGTGGELRDELGKLADVAKSGGQKVLDVFRGGIEFVKEHPTIAKAAVGLAGVHLALKGIGSVSRATPLGRGISALTAAVAGGAVTYAATAITRRGGILGKLASSFLAPGQTPARPLFVKEVNPFGGPGRGGPGGPVVAPGPGGGGTGGGRFRVFSRLAIRGLGWLGVGITIGQIATGMDLSPRDRREIQERTGRGSDGRPPGDILPGTVGDPRTVRPTPGRWGGPEETATATAVAAGRIAVETRKIERDFRRMRERTGDDVQAMARAVNRHAGRIREELGSNTAEGRRALERNLDAGVRGLSRALRGGEIDTRRYMRSIERMMDRHSGAGKTAMARNLDAAANAIRRTMRRSGQVTEDGLRIVRDLMVKELRMYGLSERDAIASANVRTGDVAGGFRRQDFKAGGGMVSPGGVIGRWGERGRDAVHTVLGKGEAVLNFLQQRIVNRALQASGLQGGLRDVFALTKGSRHHYAGGGIVGIPWAPGEEIAASALPIATRLHRMFGSTISDAFDRDRSAGHVSPGHNVTGTAADWVGGNLLGLVRWTVAHGFKTLFNTPPGTYYPGHDTHAHVEFGGGGGPLRMLQDLARVVIRGRPSPLRDNLQAAVDIGRAGAQKRIERLFGQVSMAGGAGVAGSAGTFNKAELARLWVQAGGDPAVAQLMAAIALAESGGNPTAQGPLTSYGFRAGGLWQIHPPQPGWENPLANARMAVAKYGSQGLGAWEAYTNGNYTQYLAPGGFAGWEGFGGPGWGGATAPGSGGWLNELVGRHGLLTGTGGRYGAKVSGIVGGIQRKIDRLGQRYDLKSRRFDLTEEELIDEGDEDTPPSFNEEGIARRGRELGTLIGIRRDQAIGYARMLRYLRRLQQVYSTQRGRLGAIVGSIRKRLGNLPKKGLSKEQRRTRSSLTDRLEKYRKALGTVGGRLAGTREGIRSADFERRSTLIDLEELRMEFRPLDRHIRGVPGGLELPEWQAPEDDAGGTGEPDPAEVRRLAMEQARMFAAGRASLFGEFGANFARRGSNPFAGELGQAAGSRFFGAGAAAEAFPGGIGGGQSGVLDVAGGGDIHLHQHYEREPQDPTTWSQQAAHQLQAALG